MTAPIDPTARQAPAWWRQTEPLLYSPWPQGLERGPVLTALDFEAGGVRFEFGAEHGVRCHLSDLEEHASEKIARATVARRTGAGKWSAASRTELSIAGYRAETAWCRFLGLEPDRDAEARHHDQVFQGSEIEIKSTSHQPPHWKSARGYPATALIALALTWGNGGTGTPVDLVGWLPLVQARKVARLHDYHLGKGPQPIIEARHMFHPWILLQGWRTGRPVR